MSELWGGCLCGDIAFALTGPTDFVAHCHCRSCRVSHGAPLVTWTSVPLDRFAFHRGEDKVSWYASSPWIEWGFCARCGSSMLYRAIAEGHPESPKVGRIYVTAASLAEPLDQPPRVHVSFEEKAGWFEVADALPKHRGKSGEVIG